MAINELFFTAFPEMEFDSFLTIGADNSSYPSSMHPISVWGAIDAGLEFDQDGPGTSVFVNDEVGGSWFQTPPLTLEDSLTHPAFGGPEKRVLIAQITTLVGSMAKSRSKFSLEDSTQMNSVPSFDPFSGM